MVLSALIAEKVLAAEAKQNGLSHTESDQWIFEHLREAMIEQLRRDSVENTISVSDEELQREYLNLLKKIGAKIVLTKDSLAAKKISDQLKGGKPLEQAISAEPGSVLSVTEKIFSWPVENTQIEAQLYQLDRGGISAPIRVQGGYMLIKVDKVEDVGKPSEKDFENRIPALRDHLLRRKIESRYIRFYRNRLEQKLGLVDHRLVASALEMILPELEFHQSSTGNPFGNMKALPDKIFQPVNERLKDIGRQTAVRFPSGERWTVHQLFTRLKYGPYAFNYKDQEAFEKSFWYNVQLLLEHQAIYELAKERGYEEHPEVKKEAAMWKSYYMAQAFRYELLKNVRTDSAAVSRPKNDSLTPLQEKRLQVVDDFLAEAITRHDVEINKKVFNDLTLNKTDMLVMKRHFAHRLIAPRLQPLTWLTRWQRQMDRLYRKFGIS